MKKLTTIMLLTIFMASTAVAQPQWEYKRVSHVAMGETLPSFFADLGSGADVLVQISADVRQRRDLVTATYTDKKIIDILNDIASAHGLIWYWDGQTIYINDLSELKEKKVELHDNGAQQLTETLKRYDFFDGRYPIKSNARGNVAYFSAPPRYAQLILQIAEEVNREYKSENDKEEVLRFKAFPLKYATAYDREVNYNGVMQVIPGVASLLNEVINGKSNQYSQNISSNTNSSDQTDYIVDKKIQGDVYGEVVRLKQDTTSRNSASAKATITADKQTNSIVIYDTVEKINIYGAFIEDFDKPVAQIEISVSIIDVQSDELNEIGVSWAGNGTDFDAGFGGTAGIESTNASPAFVGFGNYQNTTTLLAGQVKTMMGNIKAITENNGGKVLSKPAVVTQDNLEAIIDHVSTFYVRLEGQEEVELVPIQSGSVLRVVPRLIGDPESMQTPEIQLKVSIQDGATSTDRSVDSIPVVNSSTIKTQAVVTNGESLLVGGFYYDSEQDDVVKVPVLGDIPLIKTFFRHTKTRKVQLSRLFLITPRIVGNKLNPMQKLKVVDNVHDLTRAHSKDFYFNGMIMD